MPSAAELRTHKDESFNSDLDEIAREGARRMLAEALEAEVAADDGRRLLGELCLASGGGAACVVQRGPSDNWVVVFFLATKVPRTKVTKINC